jgi:SAM-dependent methyltransferase
VTEAPYTVLCTYLPKREKVGLLRELLREHWPTLRRNGFVTDEPPLIYQGEDASGPFFVEIVTWVDPGASSRAYWCDDVNAIWSQLFEHTEPRGSRPGIEYPQVDRIREPCPTATDPAGPRAGYREPSESSVPYWEAMYRTGRHQQAWECDFASPELVGFVSAGLVPPRGRVLDLGCGIGRDALFLASCGYEAFGLDVSGEALAIARRAAAPTGCRISWYQGDARALPFRDATFDLVTDRGCFHHIKEADRARYGAEVGRVLKPGGRLFLRGSSRARFPFVPMTPESISRAFSSPAFEVGQLLPLELVTNSGMLPGHVVLALRASQRSDSAVGSAEAIESRSDVGHRSSDTRGPALPHPSSLGHRYTRIEG